MQARAPRLAGPAMSRSSLQSTAGRRTVAAARGAPTDAGRGGNEQDVSLTRARAGAGAVPDPELPLPMAGRPAGLLGLRDGRRDPGLVRAGLDRLGPGAGRLRLAAVPRHPDLAAVRHGGRPLRQPQPALPDARHLRRRGDGAGGAVPDRPGRAGAGVRARPRRSAWSGPPTSRCATCWSARPCRRLPDAGHGRVAHHRRFGAHRRRAVGRAAWSRRWVRAWPMSRSAPSTPRAWR